MIYAEGVGAAPEKGELKIEVDPIMLLKTNTEKFQYGMIPSYL